MKTHPVRGVGMCSMLHIGQTVMHCVLFHHEKLDEAGIPRASGFVHPAVRPHTLRPVVDAFDTFTSERYFYAIPLSAHQALTFLEEEMSGLVR